MGYYGGGSGRLGSIRAAYDEEQREKARHDPLHRAIRNSPAYACPDLDQEEPHPDEEALTAHLYPIGPDEDGQPSPIPQGHAERKATPIATGFLDLFPLAVAAIARLSKAGSDRHNPGEPLHWSREKSNDHADCLLRHMIDRGRFDMDGHRHSAKVAWRALALLELELETSGLTNSEK
jgi:hypothetical protein